MMGCSKGDLNCDDDENPPHRVKITTAFEIGKYEVTQAEWTEVMGSNPSRFKGQTLPVETVSWNDVQDFLRKMNDRKDGYLYRLPTEAEWEYVARAGTTGTYATTDKVDAAGSLSVSSLETLGWYQRNSRKITHAIGQKPPNAWGLYDMEGNVWEWVQDWYSSSYYSVSDGDNPQGPAEGQIVGSGAARGPVRVQRGGSWNDSEIFARVSARSGVNPATKDPLCGFRLVRIPQN
jgi:formylglycine-generating enzyme required for sulfatase activity